MDNIRQIVYKYLNLPHYKQIQICQELSILPKNWRELRSQEFDLAVFKKFKKNKNKFKKFVKLINL